jgi:serine/threonine-protein kinase
MRYPDDVALCVIHEVPLDPWTDPRIGSTLAGRYVIESMLGEGGMATVYRARHKFNERAVAIKIMNPLLAADAKVVERFRREARHTARIAHPNIIEIYEQGDTDDGTVFMVMELLVGSALSGLIAQGPIELDRAMGLMIQVARAIARAHDFDVIHRDLKPDNVFVCPRDDGTDLVKILDFGIARSFDDHRLTKTGELFGTPQYMSPGRIRGQALSRGDDLYAMGVLFFEMITGQLPFDARDVGAFFIKHLSETPRAPSTLVAHVPHALDTLVLALLAKEERGRPVDAHAVEAELLLISSERAYAVPSAELVETDFTLPPSTLREPSSDTWTMRVSIAENLLAQAYGEPGLAPTEVLHHFTQLLDKAKSLKQARADALECERVLSQLDQRGREMRQRMGYAVHALGQDSSRAKAEAREAEAARDAAVLAESPMQKTFRAHYTEMMRLEGRFAFQSPSTQLAEAYRHAATLIEGWLDLRARLTSTEQLVAQKQRAATDLDFQIAELRANLTTQEESVETERVDATKRLKQHERDAQRLEAEMTELVRAVAGPLRGRADLSEALRALDASRAQDRIPTAEVLMR